MMKENNARKPAPIMKFNGVCEVNNHYITSRETTIPTKLSVYQFL